MARLKWASARECSIQNRRICAVKPGISTDVERLVVLKDKAVFDCYKRIVGRKSPSNVLEIGTYEGGSAVIFAEMWPRARVIGIDICQRNSAISNHLCALGIEGRVLLNYEVSQNDRAAIQDVLAKNLPGKLDLVIDDASHLYHLSRETFNIVFPYVATAGWYIIEDWGWAHSRDLQDIPELVGEPALSNLVFELVMASASTPSVITQVQINENCVAVQRGKGALPFGESLLDQLYVSRGRPISLL